VVSTYLDLEETQPKAVTEHYSSSGQALEALLKKRLKTKCRAARNNKRYKESVVDLTDEDLDPTSPPIYYFDLTGDIPGYTYRRN
jgi:hypothetical protein